MDPPTAEFLVDQLAEVVVRLDHLVASYDERNAQVSERERRRLFWLMVRCREVLSFFDDENETFD